MDKRTGAIINEKGNTMYVSELLELKETLTRPVHGKHFDYHFIAKSSTHWYLFFRPINLSYEATLNKVRLMLGDIPKKASCVAEIKEVQGNVRVELKFDRHKIKDLSYNYVVSLLVASLVSETVSKESYCV